MKLRHNLMARRWIRYVRWCQKNGEKPWWGCHVLPEAYMTTIKLAACITLIVISAGCAATQTSHIILGQPRAALRPDQVQIYFGPPPPTVAYTQIAWIETDSQWDWKLTARGHREAVIDRLKQEAAKLGANALILGVYGQETVGSLTARGDSWSYTTPLGVQVAKALAIRIEPAQATEPASPSTHLDAKPL